LRTALDTNILSAIWSREPTSASVAARLGDAKREGGLVIAGIVYAELIASQHISEEFVAAYLLRRGIAADLLLVEGIWSEAGRRFKEYAQRRKRSGGGEPRRLLADFIVGAHALLQADRLMTLDPARYEQDFPELRLFAMPSAL
jgi:predicted nucleic acid-binding protein